MTLVLPYETTGQELGETRCAMGRRLMKDLEEIMNHPKCKKAECKYYVLFHAKPFPNHPGMIKIKPMVIFHVKPSMLLSCVCFGVDNKTGTLTLEWSLPGSWPVWSCEGAQEPIPEVIGSLKELSKISNFDLLVPY